MLPKQKRALTIEVYQLSCTNKYWLLGNIVGIFSCFRNVCYLILIQLKLKRKKVSGAIISYILFFNKRGVVIINKSCLKRLILSPLVSLSFSGNFWTKWATFWKYFHKESGPAATMQPSWWGIFIYNLIKNLHNY